MTMCLSNETLMAIRLGEASPGDIRHATDCTLCGGRLAALRADLARIDVILAAPPAARVARPVRRSIAFRLVPFAVAAAAALVLLVSRGDRPVVAPAHAPSAVAVATDTVEDTSGMFASVVDDDGDGGDDGNDDDGNDDDATWAASTCALDEPFIGVGCDNGVQLTALSW